MHPQRVLIITAVTLASGAALLFPWPFAPTHWFDTLENSGHVLFFGTLAWFAMRIRHQKQGTQPLQWRDFVVVWTAITLMGGLVELLQGLTARDPSWLDFRNDGVGAGLALVSFARSQRALRQLSSFQRMLINGCSMLALASVLQPVVWTMAAYWQRWQQVPVLWQYRSPLDRYFTHHSRATLRPVSIGACSTEGVAEHARQEMALHMRLDAWEYPGFHLDEPVADWRDYATLSIVLINPGKLALPLTLRVHDRWHKNSFDDRFNYPFFLPSGPSVLNIALEDIERGPVHRLLDMAGIAGLMIFSAKGSAEAALCLVSIRLQH